MYQKECRCGKSKKQFKADIGPFFINGCCKLAGYDIYGKKGEGSGEAEKKAEAENQAAEDKKKAMQEAKAKKATENKAKQEAKAAKQAEAKAKKAAENISKETVIKNKDIKSNN